MLVEVSPFLNSTNGVVGVVGSGKGMTETLGRVKHKFQKVKMLDED
jgi:hypothetical protein